MLIEGALGHFHRLGGKFDIDPAVSTMPLHKTVRRQDPKLTMSGFAVFAMKVRKISLELVPRTVISCREPLLSLYRVSALLQLLPLLRLTRLSDRNVPMIRTEELTIDCHPAFLKCGVTIKPPSRATRIIAARATVFHQTSLNFKIPPGSLHNLLKAKQTLSFCQIRKSP